MVRVTNRWQRSDAPRGDDYDARWRSLAAAGQNVHGEADLVEALLRESGGTSVLDAGCGTGKLTQLLLQNLPRGRVVGLDVSRNMVGHAHAGLKPEFGERVEFVAADLVALPFHAAFDGIFSTASFHWVLDHDLLFRNLFASLRPGGWLHAQCGGGPNISRLRGRVRALSQTPDFSPWLGRFAEPWFFSDAESAARRLRTAGFVDVETALEDASVTVSSSDEFQAYLRTFVLHRHLELLPTELSRELFLRDLVAAAAADSPPWTLDYTRLNLRARKPELPK